VRVITARNPVHSALFLVLAFFTSAGLWIQLQAEFLAITLVLVYVGAVMVLFLFVVMMLDINLARCARGSGAICRWEGWWRAAGNGDGIHHLGKYRRAGRRRPSAPCPRATAIRRSSDG
jgi:hypothetical protein